MLVSRLARRAPFLLALVSLQVWLALLSSRCGALQVVTEQAVEAATRAPLLQRDGNLRYLLRDFTPGLGKLRQTLWLHVPKSGTSFIATLWSYACGQGKLPIDLSVDPTAAKHCGACYDFALMERYRDCDAAVFHENFTTQHSAHTAVEARSANLVGMFRRPSQRLISAYNDNLHAAGFSRDAYLDLVRTCRGRGAGCYARYPGIAGCAARMLVGRPCADGEVAKRRGVASSSLLSAVASALAGRRRGAAPSPASGDVEAAIETLRGMAFVGLMEEWDESVCLFHLMFGGKLYPKEFENMHSGGSGPSYPRSAKQLNGAYDESELRGFVDEADEAVYAAAQQRFRELRRRFAGGRSGADIRAGDAAAEPSACEALMRHAVREKDRGSDPATNTSAALPRGCAEAGRQCGVLRRRPDDAASAWLDCGSCPRSRLTLAGASPAATAMAEAALDCSPEGQCVAAGEAGTILAAVPGLFSWHVPEHFK